MINITSKIKKIIIKLLERGGVSLGQGYKLHEYNKKINNRPSKMLNSEDFEVLTRNKIK